MASQRIVLRVGCPTTFLPAVWATKKSRFPHQRVMRTIPGEKKRGVRAARSALRQQLQPMRHALLRSAVRESLFPGFRDRLLQTIRTLEEVRAADFDEELYVAYLAAITGTKHQTVRRWVDKNDPGLPDLVSFTTLCTVVGLDAAWMLGLTATRPPVLQTDSEWLHELVSDIGRVGKGLVGVRVEADEAESGVNPGDWLLIDTRDCAWNSSGLYAVAFEQARRRSSADINAPSLLFIDRERSTLTALRALFGPDYKVTTAGDGRKAIGLMQRQYFDVVVCDQRMPNMTGHQFMRSVAALSPTTVRILMTDYDDAKLTIDALDAASAHRIVLKPWIDENLRRVVGESVLLAKTLRQESATLPPAKGSGTAGNDANPLAIDPHMPDPALSAAFADQDPNDERPDWKHDRMALCSITARKGGGFTVASSNKRYGNTHVEDAKHADKLGIRIVGRVKLQISLTSK